METTIRIAALSGYRDLVFELGGDPQKLFLDLGLDDRLLLSPEERISIADYRRAMNLAAEQTRTLSFGLLLSQRQNFEDHGALGYLTKHSATLEAAINQWATYIGANQVSTEARLYTAGSSAFWEVRLPFTPNVPDYNHAETGAGLVVKFIRQNLDPLWNPTAIYFSHKALSELRLYERIFRCPVYFGSEQGCIEFEASDLKRPLRFADPTLLTILREYTQNKVLPQSTRLRNIVRSSLLNRMDSGDMKLESVAGELGLTRSQIQSRLKAEGCSFRSILDEIRIERAKKLMSDTEMSLTEITSSLGYAQSAVFTRAFKRIEGRTPSAWREANPGNDNRLN